MEKFNLCAPCLFGLEGLVGNEMRHYGMENVAPENGRVFFTGDIAAANIRSRFAERILLVVGRFPARSFEELFQGVKALPWESFIPIDGRFPVKGFAIGSQLHSVPDCQAIVKKAVVERLRAKYRCDWFKETAELCQIQFSIMKDEAVLFLDTSGEGLHKRGWRAEGSTAPLRETLAAALVDIARYRGKGDFCDPFCGSGTIAIEAALAAKNRAPGIDRHFSAELWRWLDKKSWSAVRDEARAREFSGNYHIFASDIDAKCVELSRSNAEKAGVGGLIEFSQADATRFERQTDGGVIVTNPPYGERLFDKAEAERLYAAFGAALRKTENWKLYLLSSHTEFERTFGKTAEKKRKLYNGTIKCDLFMYPGLEKRGKNI